MNPMRSHKCENWKQKSSCASPSETNFLPQKNQRGSRLKQGPCAYWEGGVSSGDPVVYDAKQSFYRDAPHGLRILLSHSGSKSCVPGNFFLNQELEPRSSPLHLVLVSYQF